MTKRKSNPKQPGPKLSHQDKTRVFLAIELQDASGIGPYSAIRQACLLYPDALPKPLPKLLKAFPLSGVRSVGRYLKHDNHLLIKEINRLQKAVATYKKRGMPWVRDTSRIVGSPSYEESDPDPEFED